MIGNQIPDLHIAYKSFIEAHDCSKLVIFSNIYKIIYASAFGGCGLVESEIKIMLDANDLAHSGINSIIYPFLLIAIHKSVVYGKMRYTGMLIQLAKKVITQDRLYEEFVNFYEKIYGLLYTSVVSNDEKEYTQAITRLSREVCHGKSVVSYYKCKVLATLGDLEKYDRVRKYWYREDDYLFQAIDHDLEYIAKKFGFEAKLYGKLNRILYKLVTDFKVPSGLLASLSYFISSTYFDLPYTVTSAIIVASFSISGILFGSMATKYFENTNRKRYEIIPVPLHLG